jgi:hypothetical protein
MDSTIGGAPRLLHPDDVPDPGKSRSMHVTVIKNGREWALDEYSLPEKPVRHKLDVIRNWSLGDRAATHPVELKHASTLLMTQKFLNALISLSTYFLMSLCVKIQYYEVDAKTFKFKIV